MMKYVLKTRGRKVLFWNGWFKWKLQQYAKEQKKGPSYYFVIMKLIIFQYLFRTK